jgi:hypothetical protein
MNFPAWYGVDVGTLIILQWIFFLATGSVPELQTVPCETGHHIVHLGASLDEDVRGSLGPHNIVN